MNRHVSDKIIITFAQYCAFVIALFSPLSSQGDKTGQSERAFSLIDRQAAHEIRPGSPASRKNSKIIYLQGAHDLIIARKSIGGEAKACITLINCYNIQI